MIHLIIGRQGSGKTLFLVYKAYQGYKKGLTVYSNIHLNFPYTPLDYDDIVNCKLEKGIVIIDEVHLLLGSRCSSNNIVNREICDGFLSMVRKKELEVYGTTQTSRKVDIRFREERDFFYMCTKWVYVNGEWIKAMTNYNYDIDTPLMIQLDVLEEFSLQYMKFNFIGNPYFPMYDSKQIIVVKGLKEKIMESRKNGKK